MRTRLRLGCLLASVTLGAACGGSNPSVPGRDAVTVPAVTKPEDAPIPELVPPYDPASTGARLDAWPLFEPLVQSRSFSSFDRRGGNDDGFAGTYSSLWTDARGEYVIFDAEGPGVLRTLWFTSSTSGIAPLDLGLVRFYLDEEQDARIAIEANAIFKGEIAPFTAPLVADNRVSTGGFVSFVPIAYARHLRITTEKRAGFYAAQYDTYAPGTKLATHSAGTLDPQLRALFANPSGAAGAMESVALDVERAGEGTLERIRFVPDHPPTAIELQAARIKITWDGASAPAVDAPLGMFFGSGLGEAKVEAIPFAMKDGTYENRIPMPYWKGFHLQVTGLSGALSIRIGPSRFRPSEAGWLHATHKREALTSSADDHEYVNHTGSGKLLGTVLAIRPESATSKQWWEGDMRTYVDGLRTPVMHGTGHEDDHLGGWSNEFLDGPYTLPLHGEPKTEMLDRSGQFNANTTLYRFFPGVAFDKQIIHSTEHGTGNKRAEDYESVTFFYAGSGPHLVETDALAFTDDASRAEHQVRVGGERGRETLTSAFEGRFAGAQVTATHVSHAGEAIFVVAVDPANIGVILRRMFDQRAARQLARIYVDDHYAGRWYVAESNGALRWAERDLVLPPALVHGKSHISLKIVPVGTPAWDASSYRVLSVVP